MRAFSVFAALISCCWLSTAAPQYSIPNRNPPPPPPPPAASYNGAPSFNSGSAPAPQSPSFGGNSFQSSSSPSGPLTVNCQATQTSSGNLKYDCSGVNKDLITLRTEHFLELDESSANSQNLDIEIPNYNIDEFIKAAFKQLGPQDGAKINILLQKPNVNYNAAKDEAPKQQVGQPTVNVNYQPVDKISVHYPTDKQYTNGGSSSSGSSFPASTPSFGGSAPAPSFGGSAPAPSFGGSAPSLGGGGGNAYSRPFRQAPRYLSFRH